MAARSGRRRRRNLGYRFRPRVEVLEERRMLAVVLVTSELDTIDFADGVTSLREGVFATNIVPGADTIEFDSSLAGKTILLTQGVLAISDGLTIKGLGADLLSIDASGSDPTPDLSNGDGSSIFNISPTSENPQSPFSVSLFGLALTGGDTSGAGGAIYSASNLRIAGCNIYDNAAGSGGGVCASQASDAPINVEIEDSQFTNNTARTTWCYGGAIAIGLSTEGSSVAIRNCDVSGNSAAASSMWSTADGGWVWGGGISVQNWGETTIVNNRIGHNTASGTWSWGGGLYVEPRGSLFISNNQFDENTAIGSWASGGGLAVEANRRGESVPTQITSTGNSVTSNSAIDGGGMWLNLRNQSVVASIRDNRIISNQAYDGGGVAFGFMSHPASVEFAGNEVDRNFASGFGGGVYIDPFSRVPLEIRASTFYDNYSANGGGGLCASDKLTISDSTFSGNTTRGSGAAILSQGPALLYRCTIAGNSAHYGGGIYGRVLTLENTIVAGNASMFGPQDLSSDGAYLLPIAEQWDSDVAYELRYCLIGTNMGVEDVVPEAPIGAPDEHDNLIGGTMHGLIDPKLAAIAQVGNGTMTQALLWGSPAINAGDPFAVEGADGVPHFDARGVPYQRVTFGCIDIGAVEFQLRPPAIAGDFNRDGAVDTSDYVVWRKGMGSAVEPFSGADGSGNGIVGSEDYGVWRAHFGETVAAVASAPAVSNLVRAAAVVAAEGIVTRPQATGDWVGLDDDVTTVDRGRKLSATREAIREVISERLGERLLSAVALVRGMRVKDGDIASWRTQGEAGGNDVEMVDCAIAELSGWELKAARRRLFSEKPHKWGWN